MADERVAVCDEDGRVVGSEWRSRVYAEGIWHAAAAVLVRDGERVYVHRRSDTKAFAPGQWDCFAGGVVAPGESPAAAAARELAEELGVAGAPLTPLTTVRYVGHGLRYHLHGFATRWVGPVRHQPDEVAEGGWLALPELVRRLADPAWPLVPDGRALLQECLRRGLV